MKRKKEYNMAGIFLFLLLSFAFPESSGAALCAFRNPDRDVYAMFPQATGYRSVIKKLDRKARKEIEKFLGQHLDYDEGGEHTFYLILKNEDVIGVIRPHAERGKHGIVEMVWAFTLDGKIKDFEIQRSRERGTALIKSEEFRRQFRGRTLKTAFTEKKSRKINTALFTLPKNAEKVSSLIAYSAKKNLFLYKLFFPEYNKQIVDASKSKGKKDSEKENIEKDKKK
ncbi:MAG TPA: hypothetical protein ENH34_05205 [Phycisphaerales bacterium]|nr:hypothetical protein [Phycisphaerales bacterium]